VADLSEQGRRELAYQHRGEVVEGSGVAVQPRQLYPTSDAYEAACAALEKHRVRADAAETKVRAIRALHVPFTKAGEQWCEACSPKAGESGLRRYILTGWPCDTIKAIEEATT